MVPGSATREDPPVSNIRTRLVAAIDAAASNGKHVKNSLACMQQAIAEGNDDKAYVYATLAILFSQWAAHDARISKEV